MSEEVKCDFNIYEKEPLTKFLAEAACEKPYRLAIAFLGLVTLPMFSFAFYHDCIFNKELGHFMFIQNVSWSLSMVFLYPFIIALSLKYYHEIPQLFDNLFSTVIKVKDDENRKNFSNWLKSMFNNSYATVIIAILALCGNIYYFYQILNSSKTDWMNDGVIFKGVYEWTHFKFIHFKLEHGFTLTGYYAAIVQTLLSYWLFHLVYRGIVFSMGLYSLFNSKKFTLDINPYHPDGCCGLRQISKVATTLNVSVFLLGIYASLKVIDKLDFQNGSIFDDIGNPVVLIAYVILAPLLFFLPLIIAHDKMKKIKERVILPVSDKCREVSNKIADVEKVDQCKSIIEEFTTINEKRKKLMREIPEWPFNFKSLEALFGTVVVPVVPAVLPFVVNLINKK